MATALVSDVDASDELWRECARWLTRCGMIRADHRANWPHAVIADLASILRDGVLLCHLLNKLDPGSIDMKAVNLKPTMAQFLSLRNINQFKRACVISFGLKEQDVFDPLMLFDLSNFHKVLCTMSKLSLSPKALQNNIPGFTAHRAKTKEEEVVYQSLKSVGVQTMSQDGMMVDPVCGDASEEIYQDLCVPQSPLELQPTSEKRDFVIKELRDTEKNYVEVLAKLKKNFMKPLKAFMGDHDHETVFYKINDLYDIHASFYKELIRTTTDPNVKLSFVFMKWREPFLVYGGYCANLSKATNLLQKLCDSHEDFNQAIIKYEKEDNNGRFKLRDVLSVPMQRILKYHLLLEKLIENTDPNHEEYNDLRRAREAMLDVAAFINEAARDSEHLAVICSLQENIVEWVTTSKLTDYGRLIKDGELKIRAHNDQNTRNRYVFIFDKAILICKQLKGQQFAFRDIIIIADYHVDERHNRAVLKGDVRTHFHFHLVRNDSAMAYTIFVRTIELKDQMIKAINDALEKLQPSALKQTNHQFELQTFDKPTQCHYCSKYLRGLIYQGYKCKVCRIATHKDCISCSGRCGAPSPLHVQQASFSSSQSSMNGDDLTLRDKLWYVGEMDRTRAESELERRENGTFLVRVRQQNDDVDKYALTLKTNNTVKHMKICSTETDDKKYYLSLSRFFSSIEDLVLNYQENSLKENFERLEENTMLLWPFRKLHAVAVKNYEPTDENQLTLKVGSPVIIIGREGYRDNYLKGRTEDNETGFFPSNCVRIEGEVRFNP